MTFPARLLEGYRDHYNGRSDEDRALSASLAKGQQPETMIISCCDSRVLLEQIFGASAGDLFIVRNVANLVQKFSPDHGDNSTSAALEFAFNGLKVKNIVVMGHSSCGGIQASVARDFQPLAEGNFVGKWMDQVKETAQSILAQTELSPEQKQKAMEQASVRKSVENLRTFSYLAEAEKAGELKLYGAWFDIGPGLLSVMDAQTGEFNVV